MVQIPPPQTNSASARRIVVVGAGIAGAETALTLAIGMPDADVTLVGTSYAITLLPDLVYVPFGVVAEPLTVSVEDLQPHGVHFLMAHVDHVDVATSTIQTTAGPIEYDTLVVAPGAVPCGESSNSFRSLEDALRLRSQLEEIANRTADGEHTAIVIRSESDDSWTAPACELALLLGTWVRAHQLSSVVQMMVATADRDVFEWFGPVGGATVDAALRRSRVEVATGVPAGRFDALGGDIVIEFGRMQARTISGLPGLGAGGWYEPDLDFAVAPGVYVVGDATALPYRAGFATAWQARRVLRHLGGDWSRVGGSIVGIPASAVEYQMDLGDSVMRARIANAQGALAHPFLGHDAEITVVPGATPDKLAGLLLHDRVIRWQHGALDAPHAFRDALVRRPAS